MIGLELNDTGILAAGIDGTLLAIEAGAPSSPGFTVLEAGHLQVGRAAEQRSRQVPRQTNHHFWDRLASAPLQDPAYAGWTHADLAHAHLKSIWEQLSPVHQDVLVAVPETYDGPQLELLAGIMKALSIPVDGFIAQGLAALPKDAPAEILLHLELYLHRTVLTVLDGRREPAVLGHASVDGFGLDRLRTAWMQAIADEFVRHTRFDPFHDASTEQALYDRLPTLLDELNLADDTEVTLTTAVDSHRIQLARNSVERSLMPLMDAIHRQIYMLQQDYFHKQPLGTILVSHRAMGLPGFCQRLEASAVARVHPLAEGAGAMGALTFGGAFPRREGRKGVPFLNRKPRGNDRPDAAVPTPIARQADDRPVATHLLYRSRGYPLSEIPLIIGCQIPAGTSGIRIHGRTEGVSRRHCAVVQQEGRLVLIDTSTYGTFVDGVKVAEETELAVGQSIRVGTPGEKLQVIACLDNHETPVT
jgi:FHA domain